VFYGGVQYLAVSATDALRGSFGQTYVTLIRGFIRIIMAYGVERFRDMEVRRLFSRISYRHRNMGDL
jgi:hypothetical protein